jgi:hypothetical protein
MEFWSEVNLLKIGGGSRGARAICEVGDSVAANRLRNEALREHDGRWVVRMRLRTLPNVDTDWKGKRRSSDTHESSTDPDARLFRKERQSGAILCYQGHILMENRSGLVVGAVVSHADGFGERASALRLLDCVPGRHAKTLGADKGCDMRDFVRDCRTRKVTPHVARNDTHQGGSAIDGRTPVMASAK